MELNLLYLTDEFLKWNLPAGLFQQFWEKAPGQNWEK